MAAGGSSRHFAAAEESLRQAVKNLPDEETPRLNLAYAVAAQALRQCGLTVSDEELAALAAELQTPAGQAKYAEQRRQHVLHHVCG